MVVPAVLAQLSPKQNGDYSVQVDGAPLLAVGVGGPAVHAAALQPRHALVVVVVILHDTLASQPASQPAS